MENGDGGGGGGRRRQYAPEDRRDSTNLRDFLRVKDDDISRSNSLAGLTLGAVINGDKSPRSAQLTQSQSNRTLLDIIRDDPNATKETKKSWKTFKDKLRLRRAGAAWTSTVPIPASDVPIQNTNTNRMISRRESSRYPNPGDDPTRPQLLRRNTSRIPERQESRLPSMQRNEENISAIEDLDADEQEGSRESSEESPAAEGESSEQPQVRMSLMALLAETDREMGLDGTGYLTEEDDEEEDEVDKNSGGGGGGGEYNNCCVCMVRHKGAAFIPCGHTFCRLCSRELWVQRGNCPLCNNFILEILDIF